MNKNKGFSLVELIVVVAIMAVLVGILAPAYLSYVEKTRRGTDENTAEEVRHAIEIAAADICVYDELKGGKQFSFSANSTIADADTSLTAFTNAMKDVFSDKKFEVKSKKYSQKLPYTVTVTANTSSGTGAALTVTGCWN